MPLSNNKAVCLKRPWTSHRRIAIDVDESDDGVDQVIVRTSQGLQEVAFHQNSYRQNAQLTSTGSKVLKATQSKSSCFGEITVSPSPPTNLQLHSTTRPSCTESSRLVEPQPKNSQKMRSRVSKVEAISLPKSAQTVKQMRIPGIATPRSETYKKSPAHVEGQLTEHQGHRGRWYLWPDVCNNNQKRWNFIFQKTEEVRKHIEERAKPHRRQTSKTTFLSLSGELRNEIYKHLIPESRILINATNPNKELQKLKNTWSSENVRHKRSKTRLYHSLDSNQIADGLEVTRNLLLANHEIKCDVEQFVYSRTTFCFTSNQVLCRFLTSASKTGLGAIRKVEVLHKGYANPELSKDKIFRDKYYAKWTKTCSQFGKVLTGLEYLQLRAQLWDWPCELVHLKRLQEGQWWQACMTMAPRKVTKVEVFISHPMMQQNRTVLKDLARNLENDLLTLEGRMERDRLETLQVFADIAAQKVARAAAKARARKVAQTAAMLLVPLVLTKEDVITQTSPPTMIRQKGLEGLEGLEGYSKIDTTAMCDEQLDYFKYQYCTQKHRSKPSMR